MVFEIENSRPFSKRKETNILLCLTYQRLFRNHTKLN